MQRTFGRYILERTIAVGGMGEVFYARQTGPDGFDRACVVKTMHPNLATDPELVEMFLEEARLTARLSHAHVAQVYDFGKIDAGYYLAMELVDGPSLHAVAKSYATRLKKLPLAPVLRMVSQAAQALDYVHRLKGPDGAPLGLVHRDISPGNLLLSRDGLVKLIDFGIARARTTQRQTRLGQIRGKLAYMSPEQLLGVPLDGRTDIFSLGLVLFELLSGRRANPGRNEVEILSSVKTASLAPIRTLRDDCPEALARVLERATARDREKRFARAADFSQALEQVIVDSGTAVGPPQLSALADEVGAELAQRLSAETRPRMRGNATVAAPVTADVPPTGAVGLTPTPLPATAAPPSVHVTLSTSTAKVGRPRRAWVAVGAVLCAVLGGSAGVLWGSLGRDKPRARAAPPTAVAVARPEPAVEVEPQPEPQPGAEHAEAEPERPGPSAEPDAPHPQPTHRPARTRWQKGEKFEAPPAEKVTAALPPAGPPAEAASASTGAVQVVSEPPTEVMVDGKAAGVTPTTLQLPRGTHRIELREPRLHLWWGREIDVDPAAPARVQWKPSHGTMDVRPVPPHVELQISVDGTAVGATPISEFSVWEGVRRVVARNAATGWSAERNVEVPPNGKVRIKVNDGVGMEVVAR
ncbi:MAG: protein kinase [Archangiaceae bacterium]|nr:protein kinase [Archangiaceae bacterium]